ncbi:hypothetical protein LSCM1_00388 [Leishmania martiniquensis]|uniref:Uncharacterized protein n=1 Tax=Leishmania martiniquensis TaxID=1580590 RepID=A0A836GHX7_9TRYP|nr:hypothetical protein LSCM1_00388 [Leishmania martiniquensis]
MTNSPGTEVDCNHGTWNEATLTCDCDDGWCTDWINQDVLGGNFLYCNSQASTPSPGNSSAATTSPLAGKSTLIIVTFALALAASCGVVVFCCYRKNQRLKNEAEQKKIQAAATQREAWLKERSQLQQILTQEGAVLRQQAWAAQETQLRNQAVMDQLVSMSAIEATPNSQLSRSRNHPQYSHEMRPLQPSGTLCACDAHYEGESSLTDTFDRWGAQEPFAQSHSYYPQGATLSATGSYTDHPDVLPPHYTKTAKETPQRVLYSSPQCAHPTNCRLPF